MNIIRLLRVLLCIPVFFAGITAVQAQNKTITGKVTDDKGAPVQGASVLVKNTNQGTSTDIEGNFSFSVPSSATTLTVSYVGFGTQEVSITGQTNVSITILPESSTLNDVIVVGYGTARRKDVTGAVASVGAKDFNQGVVSNPMQQIQGKVAGLVITQPGGDPNQDVIIRLRGQTSLTGGQTPLIVVDGVPLDDPNQISNVPAGDIASYDVLKDASATAIYGSRGANGVIIINTKKGHAGKTQVDYSGTIGMDKQAKKFNLLNAAEYKATLGPDASSYDKGGNADWQDAVSRTAMTQSHNLAVSGGTEKFNYRGSVSYLDQQGIIINSGKQEVGLRFNAQQKALNNKLDIQYGIVNTVTNRKLTDYNLFLFMINTPPTYPVHNSDGSYFGYYDFNLQNPVAQQEMQINTAKEKFSQLYGTINYELIKDLKIGVTGSLSNWDKLQDFFQPSLPLGPGNSNVNNGSKFTENKYSKKGDIHLNYLKDIGKHTIAATLVHEYNDFNYNNYRAAGQEFLLEQNDNNALGNGNSARNQIGSYRDEYELASFLGRVSYNYNSKYFLTASLRRDGSSKFGANNKWGNFPAISAAWRLSQEEFIKDITWINELKLSGGYGVTGNQDAIDPYRTLLLLSGSGRYYNPTTPTNAYPQTYSPSQNANPDLRWEERHGMNIGLDFSLFNSNFSGNINVFNDKTKNLLFNYAVPVPPFYVNSILANVGKLSNKGVEIQLNANLVNQKGFSWTAGGQISFINTKVDNLSGTYSGYKVSTDDIAAGTAQGRGLSNIYLTYLKVGYSPYVFYLPHFMGVDKEGRQLFDSSGTGTTSATNAQKKYIDASPKFNYGFNTTFTYNQWSLNVFLRGVYGQKVFNNTSMLLNNIGRLPSNNVTKEALSNGIKDKTPKASDLWLENASYMRLDNATLSYTFRSIAGFDNLRLFVTGNNLLVITKYKGLDPEIKNAKNSEDDNQAYIDYTNGGNGYYPKTRSFVFGVNVSFK